EFQTQNNRLGPTRNTVPQAASPAVRTEATRPARGIFPLLRSTRRPQNEKPPARDDSGSASRISPLAVAAHFCRRHVRQKLLAIVPGVRENQSGFQRRLRPCCRALVGCAQLVTSGGFQCRMKINTN